MMTEDFSQLPVGSIVLMSRTIICCPRCRRHGVLESGRDGSRRCIHAEASVLAGTVAEVIDHCDLAAPRAVFPAGMTRRATNSL